MVLARHCFTMPPKITVIDIWKTTLPNITSLDYKHNTHPCPHGYTNEVSYSNIEKDYYNNDIRKIVSHAVCCQGGALYIFNSLFNSCS